MRVFVPGLAQMALLAALIILVGLLLPATREGSAETVVAAPADRVLAVIVDVEAQPEWRDVVAVTRTEEGWIEMTAQGGRITFVEDAMTERISLRFISTAGYSGTWRAVKEPVADGTCIDVVERATAPSPIGRVIARLTFDPTDFVRAYLAALKTRVEA